LPSQSSVSISGPNNLNPGQTGVFNISTNSFNFASNFSWLVYSTIFPNAEQHFDLNQVNNGLFTVKPDFDVPGGYYTVQARATNACGFYPIQKTIYVEGGDGFPVIFRTANLYKIYPNPSSTELNISLINEKQTPVHSKGIVGELLNINGLLERKISIKNNKAKVNVSNLRKGVYILKIHYDGNTEGHQVIVK